MKSSIINVTINSGLFSIQVGWIVLRLDEAQVRRLFGLMWTGRYQSATQRQASVSSVRQMRLGNSFHQSEKYQQL